MKLQWICVFSFLFSFPAFSQESATRRLITYDMLPSLVREKNENVKAARTVVSASEERSGHLTRSFLPSFSLKGGSESVEYGSAEKAERGHWGVEGRLNLYSGGRDRIEEDLRKSNIDASRAGAFREYQSELRETRKNYWRLVAVKKIITDLKDAIEDNTKNIRSAKRRAGAGVATNADALEFELEHTLLTQQMKKLTLEEDLLRNRLSVALAMEEHETIDVAADLPHPPDENPIVEKKDFDSNIDVQLLKIGESIESLKRDQASRWWAPQLDLYSFYGRPSISNNDTRALARQDEWLMGIQLSINLGKGFEDRAMAKSQTFESQAMGLRAAHSQREAKAVNHETIHDLKLTHELIHDASKDIEKAKSFLKLTKMEYSRGVKNGPDLLDAFAKYYSFRARQIDLYRSYHEFQADLLYQIASTKDEN